MKHRCAKQPRGQLFRCRESDASRKIRRGFSVLEVLIAVFVTSVGLTAVLALLTGSLKTSLDNRDALVAAGLAQEGIELIQNIRDNNIAAGRADFPTSGDFRFPGINGRYFCGQGSKPDGAALTCRSNLNSPHRYFSLSDEASGWYLSETNRTRFGRIIRIVPDSRVAPTVVTVQSVVWWGSSARLPSGVFPVIAGVTTVDPRKCTMSNRCTIVMSELRHWRQ